MRKDGRYAEEKEVHMEKRLIQYGNSLVLVIDAPIRRLLGIGPNTRLRITTDGERIVVEPIGLIAAKPSRRGTSLKARRIAVDRTFTELKRRGLDDERFDRLSPMKMLRYHMMLSYSYEAEDGGMLTMDRLDTCFECLELGMSWDEAIETALTHLPGPSRAAANGGHDLGKPRPVGLGHGAVVGGEGERERGVAMNGDAMPARETDELGRERAAPGREPDRDGRAQWVPGDRDGDIVAEHDERGRFDRR
jgi:bifunctional DNA-binding transcriptional regulator/antitoxin component of YhaV-PrlF toxin-antitoxin module